MNKNLSRTHITPPLGRLARHYPEPTPSREPRKPDWLVILMICLISITIFIAWWVDIPRLLR